MKSEKKAAVLFSYINSILSIGVNIFWGPYLIHTLGDAEYGIYQMVASFAGYLVLMNFGTGTVMTRYVSLYKARQQEKEQKNFIAICLTITAGLAILIAAAGAVLYLGLDRLYATLDEAQLAHAKVIYIVVVSNIICTLLYQAFDGIIMAYERYMFSQVWTMGKTIVRVAVIGVLISRVPNAIIISLVDLALSVTYLVISVYYVRVRLKVTWKLVYWDKFLLQEITSFSMAIFLQAFVNQVNSNVDKTLLGAMVSPESVSLYSLAMSISNIFITLSTALLGIYLPQFTKILASTSDRSEVTKAAVKPARVQFFISTTVLFGFALCGKDFVVVWAGKEYLQVWDIAMILMVPMYFQYLTGIMESVLDALGKRLFRSVILSVAAVGNVVVSIFLIRKMGVIGAPVGTALATILFSVIVLNLYYHWGLGLRIDRLLRDMTKGLWKGEVGAFLVTLPFAILMDCNFLGLLVKGGVFVLALVVFELLFGVSSDEKQELKRILMCAKGKK